jgi:hypothetical protein
VATTSIDAKTTQNHPCLAASAAKPDSELGDTEKSSNANVIANKILAIQHFV